MLKLILVAFALAAALTASHALLRAGSRHAAFELEWLIQIGGALVLYATVFFVYSTILKYFEISVLYPTYTALSILGVFLVGVIYFGEAFTLQKVAGVIAIAVGVCLIAS